MSDLEENLRQLAENKPEQAEELAELLWYVDEMEGSFKAVCRELQAVRHQLADIQDHSIRAVVSNAVEVLEDKIEGLRDRLADAKDTILAAVSRALDCAKQTGISALDKTVSFLGIKDTLKAIREELSHSLSDAQSQITKIETIGQELRGVGGHLKNVGRAAIEKYEPSGRTRGNSSQRYSPRCAPRTGL